MSESSFLLACLGTLTACLVVLTVTVLLTARTLRVTLHRVDAFLPKADQAMHEVHRSFVQVRRLLVRGDRAARRVETVVAQLCDTALGAVDQLAHLKGWVAAPWFHRKHNGAGAEPRRHHGRG